MVCCTVYGIARILECDSFQWVCNVTQTSQFFRSCKLFSHKKNYCSLLFIKLVSEWAILFSLKKWQRVGSLLESSVCINDKIFQNYYIFKSDRSFIKRSSYFFKEHVQTVWIEWLVNTETNLVFLKYCNFSVYPFIHLLYLILTYENFRPTPTYVKNLLTHSKVL